MTEPTPILFTIPNFTTAGSGRAMLNIVERLDRSRFRPTICTLKRGGNLEAEIERLGIPYMNAAFAVSARPLATLAMRAHRAATAFRSRGFVMWHSFHYLDDYTEPLVARFAGARAWIYTKKNMNWNRRSWWLRSQLASRVAAQNTDMVRDFFASPRLRRKTVLVPRGVDTERFRPDVPQRLGLRQKLGVPPDAVVAGCVAQLLPVKGHPTLIEALARVPGLRLWLAGKALDEPYVAGLREKVRALGLEDRVAFLGEVQDVPAFLAELDVFVLPTWNEWRMEGCPVALLEAMSSARPCVATDIPGSRDIVENERSGVLVPPQDEAALAGALGRLAGDAPRRKALGEAARDRVRAHYAIEVEVRAHENLYGGLLDALPARRAA
ncbi:MAG TPA: glycosyltransferase [Thermoanaerobaculia bacterium]|nr:glycosyltransferase [Thermoanaerobaculia bacterium]